MGFIKWDDSHLLGNREFDEHHKQLVSLLNKAYNAFLRKTPPEDLQAILDELLEYAHCHFTAERRWMEKHNYPALREHTDEHNIFYKRVTEMKEDLLGNDSTLSLEVFLFLKTWLGEHVLTKDADYCKSAGSVTESPKRRRSRLPL